MQAKEKVTPATPMDHAAGQMLDSRGGVDIAVQRNPTRNATTFAALQCLGLQFGQRCFDARRHASAALWRRQIEFVPARMEGTIQLGVIQGDFESASVSQQFLKLDLSGKRCVHC